MVAKNFSRHDIFRASSIGTPIFASQVSYYSFLDLNIDLLNPTNLINCAEDTTKWELREWR